MPAYQNTFPPISLMPGDVGFSFNNEAFPGSAQAGSQSPAAQHDLKELEARDAKEVAEIAKAVTHRRAIRHRDSSKSFASSPPFTPSTFVR